MRILLTSALLLALLVPARPSAARSRQADSLRKATRAMLEALLRGDRKAARAQLLTHAQLARISSRAPNKARYRERVDRWLGKLLAEFAEAKKRKGKVGIGKPHILDVHLLPRSQKRARAVVFAVVSPTLIVSGKKRSGLPFYYIADGGHWRISIKK